MSTSDDEDPAKSDCCPQRAREGSLDIHTNLEPLLGKNLECIVLRYAKQ